MSYSRYPPGVWLPMVNRSSLRFLVDSWTGHAVLGFTGIVLFVVLWKVAQSAGWSHPGTIPDPFQIPAAFLAELHAHRFVPAVESSLIHYGWGLAEGTVLGVAIGALAASSRVADALLGWLVRVLRPIPPLAWVVFAIAWFGVSHAGAAFVIAIGLFWTNYLVTYAAVRDVDPRYYEVAKVFHQDTLFARFLRVTLPAAAPGILSGIRTGVGEAWMILIAAELLGVPGMGQEMNAAAGVGAYATVVVYMLAISVIYTLCDSVFLAVEKRVLQWRPS